MIIFFKAHIKKLVSLCMVFNSVNKLAVEFSNFNFQCDITTNHTHWKRTNNQWTRPCVSSVVIAIRITKKPTSYGPRARSSNQYSIRRLMETLRKVSDPRDDVCPACWQHVFRKICNIICKICIMFIPHCCHRQISSVICKICIMFIPHCCHRQISMVIADDLVLTWRQAIATVMTASGFGRTPMNDI